MDRTLQQKLLLESEIRLLEKQKQDLYFSLEKLDSTHKEAYSQNTQIIKELTKRKEELLSQIDQLREGMSVLTSAYTQAKESLEEFKNHKWLDVEDDIKKARNEAKTIIEDAVALKRDADIISKAAIQREQKLIEMSNKLSTDAQEIIEIKSAVDKSYKEDQRRHVVAMQEYDKLKVEIEVKQASLATLREKQEALEQKIKQDEKDNTTTLEIVKEKFAESERRVLEDKNRSELLDKRAQELEDEARVIKDRRETLDRAIKELRAKGVKI